MSAGLHLGLLLVDRTWQWGRHGPLASVPDDRAPAAIVQMPLPARPVPAVAAHRSLPGDRRSGLVSGGAPDSPTVVGRSAGEEAVAAPPGDGIDHGAAPVTLAQYRMALLIALRDALRGDPVWSAPALSISPARGRLGVRLLFEQGLLSRDEPLSPGSDAEFAPLRRQALQVARQLVPPPSLAGQSFAIDIEWVVDAETRSGAP